MSNATEMTEIDEKSGHAILSIGRYGMHLHKTPNKRWNLCGTIIVEFDALKPYGGWETFTDAIEAFFRWLDGLATEEREEYVGKLRADVLAAYASRTRAWQAETPAGVAT